MVPSDKGKKKKRDDRHPEPRPEGEGKRPLPRDLDPHNQRDYHESDGRGFDPHQGD